MGNALRAATVTTAAVANTSAGLYTFSAPASYLTLYNFTGQPIKIAYNSTASATVFDRVIADGETVIVKASDLGVGTFDTISAWMPTSATVTNITVRGI